VSVGDHRAAFATGRDGWYRIAARRWIRSATAGNLHIIAVNSRGPITSSRVLEVVTTVSACVRAGLSMPASPKESPSPSSTVGRPSCRSSALPDTITQNSRARSPSLASVLPAGTSTSSAQLATCLRRRLGRPAKSEIVLRAFWSIVGLWAGRALGSRARRSGGDRGGLWSPPPVREGSAHGCQCRGERRAMSWPCVHTDWPLVHNRSANATTTPGPAEWPGQARAARIVTPSRPHRAWSGFGRAGPGQPGKLGEAKTLTAAILAGCRW
jgi:hypothetical protein